MCLSSFSPICGPILPCLALLTTHSLKCLQTPSCPPSIFSTADHFRLVNTTSRAVILPSLPILTDLSVLHCNYVFSKVGKVSPGQVA